MGLLKPRCSVVCLFLVLLLSIGRLAVEYLAIGNRLTLQRVIPLMWLFLSLGFVFTLCDMVRGLYACDIISECLQCRFGLRDWSVFKWLLLLIIALSTIFAAWDMWLRWAKFDMSWTGDYPWYSQRSLDLGAFLYIAFILLQGKSEPLLNTYIDCMQTPDWACSEWIAILHQASACSGKSSLVAKLCTHI